VSRLHSLCRFIWRIWRYCSGRRLMIKSGSGFKPDFGELLVGRAYFRCVRFSRPSEALFGQGPILGGRFHNKTSLPANCSRFC
jgi:hypothetical protein